MNIFHSFYNYMYAQRFRFCTFLLLQSYNFVTSLPVIIMWVIYGQVRLFSTCPTAKKTPASTCSRVAGVYCLLSYYLTLGNIIVQRPRLLHYFIISLFHYFTSSLLQVQCVEQPPSSHSSTYPTHS